MFVYAIINRESRKVYIGKTITLDLKAYLRHKVWSALTGRYKGRSHLFAAMRKHSSDAWSIHSLISCLTTEWQLNLWEKALIYAFDSTNPKVGYNLCQGGEGHTGYLSLETRTRMSKTRKLMWSDPEYYAKTVTQLAEAKKRKWSISPELRLKAIASISRNKKQKWSDPKWRQKQIERMQHRKKGHHLSDSHKLALSKALKRNLKLHSKERKAGADKGRHTRWHTSRGVVNPKCRFCSTERV